MKYFRYYQTPTECRNDEQIFREGAINPSHVVAVFDLNPSISGQPCCEVVMHDRSLYVRDSMQNTINHLFGEHKP